MLLWLSSTFFLRLFFNNLVNSFPWFDIVFEAIEALLGDFGRAFDFSFVLILFNGNSNFWLALGDSGRDVFCFERVFSSVLFIRYLFTISCTSFSTKLSMDLLDPTLIIIGFFWPSFYFSWFASLFCLNGCFVCFLVMGFAG